MVFTQSESYNALCTTSNIHAYMTIKQSQFIITVYTQAIKHMPRCGINIIGNQGDLPVSSEILRLAPWATNSLTMFIWLSWIFCSLSCLVLGTWDNHRALYYTCYDVHVHVQYVYMFTTGLVW